MPYNIRLFSIVIGRYNSQIGNNALAYSGFDAVM